MADKSGCLWGGHSDGIHIVKFDKSAAVVASEALPEKSAFRSVAIDSLGRVWFGRNDGLLIRDTGTMESVEDSRLAKLCGLGVRTCCHDDPVCARDNDVCMPGVGIYTVELTTGVCARTLSKRFDLSYRRAISAAGSGTVRTIRGSEPWTEATVSVFGRRRTSSTFLP